MILSEPTRPDRLDALTSIRFVFSLMVVGTHFSGYHPDAVPGWIGPLGNIAVSWFFILSGFILAYNFPRLGGGRLKLKFIISRFFRLFSVQALTIMLSLYLFPSGWGIVQSYALYFYQALTMTQSWTAIPFASQVFNVPAWSISDEWFFYLFFPVLIQASWPWRLAVGAVAASASICGMTALGCWAGQAAFQAGGDSFHPTCYMLAIYWPPIRLLEFIIGIAMCEMTVKIRQRPFAGVKQVIVTAMCLVLFINIDHIVKSIDSSFIFGFFATWILSAAVGAGLIFSFALPGPLAVGLSMPFLVFLGEISFSVYMTHMLVLRYISETLIGSNSSIYIQFLGMYLVVTMLSAVVYMIVETPSRKLVKAALQKF